MYHLICANQSIGAGETWTQSQPSHLWDGRDHHAYEIHVSGDGTVKLTTYTSVSGSSWIKNRDIVSGLTKTSGPDSDGSLTEGFWVVPGEFIKFALTETGGANSVTVTLWFCQK